MKYNKIFKIIFIVWVALWVVFLVRENKKGRYGMILDLYRIERPYRAAYLMGNDLYGFLAASRDEMTKGSTYEIIGFDKYSIEPVRMRYFLWPLRAGKGNVDYKIVCKDDGSGWSGYKVIRGSGLDKKLLVNKDICP